jgi:hypothetical protein
MPPPQKKLKKKQPTEDIDKIIGYSENKNKNQLDGIDYLFLSYAEPFKQFPPRKQAMLKIELTTLFARAEMSEMDAQTAPASSPHFIASSTGSGITSDESNAPLDSTEQTYLLVSTNVNNTFQTIDHGCVWKCISSCATSIKDIFMFQKVHIVFVYSLKDGIIKYAE